MTHPFENVELDLESFEKDEEKKQQYQLVYLNHSDYLEVINRINNNLQICRLEDLEDLKESDFSKPWSKLDLTLKVNRLVHFLQNHSHDLFQRTEENLEFPNFFQALTTFIIKEMTNRNNLAKLKKFIDYDVENSQISDLKIELIEYDFTKEIYKWKDLRNQKNQQSKSKNESENNQDSDKVESLQEGEIKQLEKLSFTF